MAEHDRPMAVSLVRLLMLVVVLVHSLLFYLYLMNNLSNLGLGDLGIYQIQYNNMLKHGGLTQNTDFGFYYLMLFYANYSSFELFVLTCFFTFYLALIRPFYRSCEVKWVVFVVFLAAFFYPMYQSLSSLVLRQGMGIAFLFLTAFFFHTRSFLRSVLKVMLAATFHISLLFYVPVLIASRFIASLKLLVLFWCLVVVLYAADVPSSFVNLLPADMSGAVRAFSLLDDEYTTGFKASFLLLSIVPFPFILVRRYYYYVCQDPVMFEMFKIYFIANSAGLLCGGFPYYDRAMLFSWILVPLIMLNFVSFLYPRQPRTAGVRA